MKKEELISFETAKLAKEAGFNLPCHYYIWDDMHSDPTITESFFENNGVHCMRKSCDPDKLHTQEYFTDGLHYTISLPSQSLLQRWLREEHSIETEVHRVVSGNYQCDTYKYIPKQFINARSTDEYCTYESALESGLQEALKLIKE